MTGASLTETTELAVVFENVKNTAHLGEDQNARSLGLHGLEKLVKDDHLSGVVNQVLVCCVWRSRLGTIED